MQLHIYVGREESMAQRPEKSLPPGDYSTYKDARRGGREADAKIIEDNYHERIEKGKSEKRASLDLLIDGDPNVLNEAAQQKVLNEAAQKRKDFQAAQEAYRKSDAGKDQAKAHAASTAERDARPKKLWGKAGKEEWEAWKVSHAKTTLRQMQGLLAEL